MPLDKAGTAAEIHTPVNAAEALLMRLKQNGVDYLFANAGTDFAPVIEGYAAQATNDAPMPVALAIPHETAAVAMAHGYYLVTGRPQAVMVHVNVGLANSICGLINAASDQIPLFMMSGRTPLTEFGRLGSRMTPIQYGQEMRDQSGMVREVTKWDYELRYPEQTTTLVDRGIAIAMTEPRGPVFLSLPREPLAEAWPDEFAVDVPLQSVPSRTQPDPDAVAKAAVMLAAARNPLIIAQRSDPEGRLSDALATLAESAAIPVIENQALHNNLPTAHPMHGGYDVGPWLGEADVIVVVQSQVPWLQRSQKLAEGAKVIHVGTDPLFQSLPVRSFQNDLAIAGDAAATLTALVGALVGNVPGRDARAIAINKRTDARRAEAVTRALEGDGSPMTPAFVSKCISDILGDDGVVFSELGANPGSMNLRGANRCFRTPFSGGLGWGMPAALGAALADRDRLCIACIGDGSYIFANPVACHQVAEALELPLLTVVMNNGIWNAVRRAARNVYPDGKATRMNTLPITSLEPLPDFCKIAEASRAHAERVEIGTDLPAALERAVQVIRTEKRQAFIEVRVAIPN